MERALSERPGQPPRFLGEQEGHLRREAGERSILSSRGGLREREAEYVWKALEEGLEAR